MKFRAREIGKMTKLTAMEGALFERRLEKSKLLIQACSYIFINVHHPLDKLSSRYQHVDGSTYEGEWIADRQWEIPVCRIQAKACQENMAAAGRIVGHGIGTLHGKTWGRSPKLPFMTFHGSVLALQATFNGSPPPCLIWSALVLALVFFDSPFVHTWGRLWK